MIELVSKSWACLGSKSIKFISIDKIPYTMRRDNAVLTGAVGFSSKRSLIEKFAAAGPVPGSGARRRNQGLDAVSTAFSAAQPPRMPKITGSKKYSAAPLFAVRVNFDC